MTGVEAQVLNLYKYKLLYFKAKQFAYDTSTSLIHNNLYLSSKELVICKKLYYMILP